MATVNPQVKATRGFTGWYLAAAVLFIVLGFFAILEPAVAGLGVALLIGWLLVLGGIAHLVSTFQGGGTRRVALHVLAGIVFLLGGLYLLLQPLPALGTLTLLLAVVIIAAGLCEIIAYLRHRSAQASGWLLFNGIIALLLGGLIGFHWPSSSVWAIGTLVGVNLLLTGYTRLMLALAGRRLIAQP